MHTPLSRTVSSDADTLALPPEGAGHATAYAGYQIIRRNGAVVSFEPHKIAVALMKAFLAVRGAHGAASASVRETVDVLTETVVRALLRSRPSGGTFHIEDVQDQVELGLMRGGYHDVARAYVLYRERRAQERLSQGRAPAQAPTDVVVQDHGQRKPLDQGGLQALVESACAGLGDEVTAAPVLAETRRNLYDGVPVDEVYKAAILAARTLIEKDPGYTRVTARLLMHTIRREVLDDDVTQAGMVHRYPVYFPEFVRRGVEAELLDERLLQFDLPRLGAALRPERDMNFDYLGLQTLYDRYFLHVRKQRIELPQAFFMRVAMGLALNEVDREARAIEFYEVLSSFDFMSSTPTLFNAGTRRSQLSSCYLTTVPDDLDGIYESIKDNALLSKFAGGLGNDWSRVRGMGAHIKGTNGKSQGVVPFLKVANDTAVAVNQGGKRKGAVCAYLETWHIDIEEFLELRKNVGDERRRTHDMNTANWVPDLFMKRVAAEGDWSLFSPDETPDLHDLTGQAFEAAYVAYEERGARGELKVHKRLKAVDLWRKMLAMLFETGHPWIAFKDPCNLRYTNQHAGRVHSSNLCTEITLHTNDQEIAVCNLGSVNLAAHVTDQGLDLAKLQRTVATAMRMLDNVIDYNFYNVPQARRSNLRHRPVGLGLMGFQDALYKLRLPYASQAAVQFADQSMEAIAYYAIQASTDLAEERGRYASFDGSLWSQGILPLDSIALLEQGRGGFLQMDQGATLDWDALRARVQAVGMRNSNCMAIAPTATISNIVGVSQSIEPTYQNLFVKSNLSGEFTVVNPHLVRDLKALGLWDPVMVNDLKYFDGSVQPIERVPQELKDLYATAFEIDPRWLVEAGSRRQKWLDQAQSLNLYMKEPNGKKLDNLYKLAWVRGLKTTYYLRSMGATHVEKSTMADPGKGQRPGPIAGIQLAGKAAAQLTAHLNGQIHGQLNGQKVSQTGERDEDPYASIPVPPKACSLLDPECEACQ